jgi:hypothetical protein
MWIGIFTIYKTKRWNFKYRKRINKSKNAAQKGGVLIEISNSKVGDLMKHPNGYGTVAKLSGNRRNPFVVRKTKGWDECGYPVYETIGYYPTREAGLIALAQYNNNPWNISQEKTTLEELFKLWLEKKAPKLGDSNRQSLKSAYNHCKTLYQMKYKAVKAFNMQDCIDNCGKGYSTQGAIKNLFGHLDKFALELDVG